MVTELQKKIAQAIVNIFETGHVRGDYGLVTLLPGDTGHLTYGRSQTTLGSGNLYLLIKAYCEAPGAEFAADLTPYLGSLQDCDATLDNDVSLRRTLRSAGDDPVMRVAQDQFFDRVYWTPCINVANSLRINSALGTAVIYDSWIHGSWKTIRERTTSEHGSVATIGENAWITNYVGERRDWLANHSNALLHETVYRMDTFRQLIDAGKWELSLPLRVRGVEITGEMLVENVRIRVSARDAAERILRLKTPALQGTDIKEVQQALVNKGIDVGVDGVFGPETDLAVKQFQRNRGLKQDGIVGPATRSALGL